MADRPGARSLAAYHVALLSRSDSRHHCRLRRIDPDRHFFRLKEFMSDEGESRADTFYSGALTRIPRFMIALGVTLSAGGWFRFGWRIALGFACGCAIAYLNFHWLERVVSALADRATQTAYKQSSGGIVFRFLVRYFLMAAAAYAIFRV